MFGGEVGVFGGGSFPPASPTVYNPESGYDPSLLINENTTKTKTLEMLNSGTT